MDQIHVVRHKVLVEGASIRKVAKEMGILTVGVVTKPFDWEGGRRMTNADQGLMELEANVDSLIVVLNEKLLGYWDIVDDRLAPVEASYGP